MTSEEREAQAFSSGWEAAMCFISDKRELQAVTRKCENCQWWIDTPGEGPHGFPLPSQCRAAPPQMHDNGPHVSPRYVAAWPTTWPDHWCGSFRLREGLETDTHTIEHVGRLGDTVPVKQGFAVGLTASEAESIRYLVGEDQ